MPIPSITQAKFLARVWGSATQKPAVGSSPDPTVKACIKNGWLEPIDQKGVFPNGQEFERYDVSANGLRALAKALRVRAT